MTFSLEMLPAREGDCLLLSYTDGMRRRHVLVDGGRSATCMHHKTRLEEIPDNEREFELLVISHIDRDHIEGVVTLLSDQNCPITFKDIWFNGYGHLKAVVDEEYFGGVQGEKLTELLLDGLPWNLSFAKKSLRVPKTDLPPSIDFPGGLKLTLLSPTADQLLALEPFWKKECEKAGILPTEELPQEFPEEEHFGAIDVDSLADEAFEEDSAKANGSSIALLAEYQGRRVLLGADAYPGVVLEALNRVFSSTDRIHLDAFKVAHHGSRANLSAEMLNRIDCRRYVISTNGSYFKHPSRQAMARILKYGGPKKDIVFNYKTQYTEIWDEASLLEKHGYSVIFGDEGSVVIEL
jgi:hypothetical protein